MASQEACLRLALIMNRRKAVGCQQQASGEPVCRILRSSWFFGKILSEQPAPLQKQEIRASLINLQKCLTRKTPG